MKTKEWKKMHELNWSDSLELLPSKRTHFQDKALNRLLQTLESKKIKFEIQESEIRDHDSQQSSNQMIKVEIDHDCLQDSFIYFNQIDFTADNKTFHFEFWGYIDPNSLIDIFLEEIKKKIENCA